MSIKTLRPRERKELMRKLFEDLIKKHRYLIIIDAYRLRANMLSEVRLLEKELGFIIKGGKKGVFLKALERIYPDVVDVLKENLHGQVLFIFTNNDPFDIAYELDKFEMDLEASPGDIAPIDIVIPEGNTGLPPGPIIGLFSSLSIPTKIVAGAIYIVKDTLAAKKGDRISPNLANILSKLGIKPIKSKVNIRFAYDFKDKLLIPRELLLPNIEEYVHKFEDAVSNAFKLGVEISYPSEIILPVLITKAYLNAFNLSIESGYPTEYTIAHIISKAVRIAKNLKGSLSSA
ncbi:50S ribosomal protein L10 [Candidatus Geothermarchaeota archaeon]|nr:MAG: 50S ribosomal protein L10 [Candidatus Geothermarchaeota archaeon]HEW93940.1 50S ribosomal protein L10 [Thermoprotei archaeon]